MSSVDALVKDEQKHETEKKLLKITTVDCNTRLFISMVL